MSHKVLHISSGIDTGGAEVMLYRLVKQSMGSEFPPEVISLTGIGQIGQRLLDEGVSVRALNMKPGVPNPFALVKLRRWIKEANPSLVQTWMYHGDLLGGVMAKAAGSYPVIWNIQNSNLDSKGSRRTTIWISQACAKLSRALPHRISCCSQASIDVHAAGGYDASKMLMIPNGTDVNEFRPDPVAREEFRREIGVDDDTVLIGTVARFDPQKDHENFVKAAGILNRRFGKKVHYVLCGKEIDWQNERLCQWIRENGVQDNMHLMGIRRDTPKVMAALDILAISSSFGEGFPLVSGEAMACGVPLAVTDIGDSASIVADTGRSVPPRDSEALAGAWEEMIDLGPEGLHQLGLAARKRIVDHFSLDIVVKKYHDLYREVLRESSANASSDEREFRSEELSLSKTS